VHSRKQLLKLNTNNGVEDSPKVEVRTKKTRVGTVMEQDFNILMQSLSHSDYLNGVATSKDHSPIILKLGICQNTTRQDQGVFGRGGERPNRGQWERKKGLLQGIKVGGERGGVCKKGGLDGKELKELNQEKFIY